MKKWVIKSGIQRKYLRYIMGLLLLAILLSSIGVWIYVRQSLTTEVTDKYEFLNEKMGLALQYSFPSARCAGASSVSAQ